MPYENLTSDADKERPAIIQKIIAAKKIEMEAFIQSVMMYQDQEKLKDIFTGKLSSSQDMVKALPYTSSIALDEMGRALIF